MGTAYIHPNMQRRCEGKERFPTIEDARKTHNTTFTVIFCPICHGYHHSSQRRDNYLEMTATPDEVVEMFR